MSIAERSPPDRWPILDVLRGLAAAVVCFYHFGHAGIWERIPGGIIAEFGYLGVYAFFVISGLVIPLSLHGKAHHLRNFSVYLLRRFLRLYPAYLAAIFVFIGLWWVSAQLPSFRGTPPDVSLFGLGSNVLLACDFLHTPWIIVVSWTLAIEAQYYVLVGLAMPGLNHSNEKVRNATVVVWILLPVVFPFPGTVFPFCAVFSYGLLLYGRHYELISARLFWVAMGLASLVDLVAGGLFTGAAGESTLWVKAGVGVSTAILILNLQRWGPRLLVGLGTISYSLYLLHVPIGGRIMNFAARYELGDGLLLVVILGAFLASCGVAWVFYRLVELPSHRWARRLRLAKTTDSEI